MNYVLFSSTFIKLLIKRILTSIKRHSAQLFFIYMIKERMTTLGFTLAEIMDLNFPGSRSEFPCNQLNETQ